MLYYCSVKKPSDIWFWTKNSQSNIVEGCVFTAPVVRPEEEQQTGYIVTSGCGTGHWFQSTGIRITGSNQLVFQAAGSRDAILGLATSDEKYIYFSLS